MRNETSPELDTSAIHMLHRASQAADELFASETSGADLTPRQFAVLAALEVLESASQTQIVDATGIEDEAGLDFWMGRALARQAR